MKPMAFISPARSDSRGSAAAFRAALMPCVNSRAACRSRNTTLPMLEKISPPNV